MKRKKVILAVVVLAIIGAVVSNVIEKKDRRLYEQHRDLQNTSQRLNETKEKERQLKEQTDKLHQEKQVKDGEIQKKDTEINELKKQVEVKNRAKLASVKKPAPAAPVKATAGVMPASVGCAGIVAKLARLGVPANQLAAASKLINKESTCNEYAVNKSSGACGALQSLPCGKWGAPGTDQYYRGAIAYANKAYGGYNGAWAHSQAKGWY